jgi:hypothetical protein
MPNEMLLLARRHVVEGRKIVARQRQRVRDREAKGLDASTQRQTLEVFEHTLAIFEKHLEQLDARTREHRKTRQPAQRSCRASFGKALASATRSVALVGRRGGPALLP